ncbi:hypothetical protein QR77_01025 [Streptomyces sp. 150FB]|uniref:SCO0930 family lipoprotein n=1 Tax=Streptomyces sp. 150FB TaxID=1576605 RepID=UPI000588F95D|nr:SCO0930 family lipoprotein [Streptomyces sp. 150FB]KIF72961.1 hypothetical protein QR77_01025 [Streptomyces sp. 150FB]
MKKNTRSALLVGAAATMLIGVTACGQETSPAKAASSGSAAPSISVVPGSASVAPSAGAGQLAVRTDAKLKSIVADGQGMTLYVFTKDEATPGKSTCDGDCATAWPPVPADATVSDGLNKDLLGSVTRTDGSKQLTLAGKPLYYFAKDTKPGDTNGQGVGGTWYAAQPDGGEAGSDRPGLGVLDDPKLGKILTDKNGKTLYLFTKDTPWPMKTACDATCLKQWTPSAPVTAEQAKAAGLDPKVLFTFNTPNGTAQESYNCWPAYTFNGDAQPGQTNGQNIGGVWFAIKQDIPGSDKGKTIPAAKG